MDSRLKGVFTDKNSNILFCRVASEGCVACSADCMDALFQFLKEIHTSEGIRHVIVTGGMYALVGIVFAETGLLVGFFLPGDSLLIAAGILAAQGHLNIFWMNLVLTVAAIVGDQVGYVLGLKTGQVIFSRPDSLFFKKKHAVAAHEFYLRHGGKAIVLARFLPILRTFVPFIAGVAEMPYRRFVFFNILGGILWVASMLWTGYLLGQTPYAKRLDQVIVIVVILSFLPLAFGAVKAWLKNRNSSDS